MQAEMIPEYSQMYDTAVREIIDEYERVSGKKAGNDVQIVAALAGDQAIMFKPEWRSNGEHFCLYFNEREFAPGMVCDE